MIPVSTPLFRWLGALAIVLISSVAENHSSAAPLGETESTERTGASKSELYTRRALDLIFGREGDSYKRDIVYKRINELAIYIAVNDNLHLVKDEIRFVLDQLRTDTDIEFHFTDNQDKSDIAIIVYDETHLDSLQELDTVFSTQLERSSLSEEEIKKISCFNHQYLDDEEDGLLLSTRIFINNRLNENKTKWCLIRHVFGALGGWGLDGYMNSRASDTVFALNERMKFTELDLFVLSVVYSEDISPGDGIDEVVAKISSMNK